MRARRSGVALLVTVALAAATTAFAAFKVPSLRGPVVDDAGLLDAATERLLDQGLRRLWSAGGSQVAVLTVPTLDGMAIEQASIAVTDAWKLGSATQDNGILLMVARDERSVRIEVGQGREGELTDAYARRIIDQVIVPHFKSGDFDRGVVAGVQAILSYTDPSFDLGMQAYTQRPTHGVKLSWPILIFFLLIIMISRFTGGTRGMRRHGGFGSWGGGSSWGGGGGSSWGGGGGGFSGGGASGKW